MGVKKSMLWRSWSLLQVINPEIVSGSRGCLKRGLSHESGKGAGRRDIVIERKRSSETVGKGTPRRLSRRPIGAS